MLSSPMRAAVVNIVSMQKLEHEFESSLGFGDSKLLQL